MGGGDFQWIGRIERFNGPNSKENQRNGHIEGVLHKVSLKEAPRPARGKRITWSGNQLPKLTQPK
jgi:hypothetical protein